VVGANAWLLKSVWASGLIADIMGGSDEEHQWLNTI
jgi:hypothetical protein